MTKTKITKPEKPLDDDCCGNGCTPCVWDHYYDQLSLWNEQQKEEATPAEKSDSGDYAS